MNTPLGKSLPVSCTLRAIVSRDEEISLATILECCFPDCDNIAHAAVEAVGAVAGEPEPQMTPSEITLRFQARAVPLWQVRALSQHLPEIRFLLEYEFLGEADRESSRRRIAEYVAGAPVRHECESDEVIANDESEPVGVSWLRRVAEKLLEASYLPILEEAEHGCDVPWKSKADGRVAYEAFVYLKNLLEPCDQEIVEALQQVYRVRIDVACWRNDAANAAAAIAKCTAAETDVGSSCSRLTLEERQQLLRAADLLNKVASGVSRRAHDCEHVVS